jgi:hypothetical protein
MANTAKSKADLLFAESEKKTKKALNEREKARQKSAARNAELRGLRLAKEAAEKEAADLADAESASAKKKKKPSRKPRVY